jgi:hypothetical protein
MQSVWCDVALSQQWDSVQQQQQQQQQQQHYLSCKHPHAISLVRRLSTVVGLVVAAATAAAAAAAAAPCVLQASSEHISIG